MIHSISHFGLDLGEERGQLMLCLVVALVVIH